MWQLKKCCINVFTLKKKNIIIVIVFISIALVGLVAMQLYWINNAIKLEQTNFNRKVNDALYSVINKLEKNEITAELRKYRDGNTIFNMLDSLNALFSKDSNDVNDYSTHGESFSIEKVEISFSKKIDGDNKNSFDTSIVSKKDYKIIKNSDGTQGQIILDSNIPKINPKAQKINKKMNRYLKKTQLVSNLFEDIFNYGHYKPIERRLDFKILDSLIKTELGRRNIETPFEYGVFSRFRNSVIAEKSGKYHKELLDKSLAYTLYPSDMFITSDLLLLYFPEEKKFLLTQLWFMLLSSAILIASIAFLFAYTVITLIRQKKLSDMKNDFINNMTHEIKTPISTISLACEALNDSGIKKTPVLYDTYISVIGEENKRLGNLTEKILQTAIIDKGELKLKKESFNINEALEEVINNIGIQIKKKNGEITLQNEAVNPSVQADRVHLSNVFFNLIDNANKYSPENPIIILKTENNEKGVFVSIIDNGIGISKSNQKKIFDKLYRVPTGNIHDVKGFGLGLSYVRAIVEMHGGNISVESELKKGSTFKIFIPFENK